MKKELFNTAWQFLKDGLFTSFKDALKAAWTRFKLLSKLRNGVAKFQFKKVDGEVRTANGTLHAANFQYASKASDRAKNNAVICFFDMDKQAFRSLKIENFISFI